MRGIIVACTAFWLVVLTVLVPAVAPLLPGWWWLDVRDVRVDSDTLVVTLDRDIRMDFRGDIGVTLRSVSEPTRAASICRGERVDVPFVKGKPYPSRLRNGQPVTLAWFMDFPPNAGCDLPADSSWVADFTWTWRPIPLFPGLALRTAKSSNIFHVTEARDL